MVLGRPLCRWRPRRFPSYSGGKRPSTRLSARALVPGIASCGDRRAGCEHSSGHRAWPLGTETEASPGPQSEATFSLITKAMLAWKVLNPATPHRAGGGLCSLARCATLGNALISLVLPFSAEMLQKQRCLAYGGAGRLTRTRLQSSRPSLGPGSWSFLSLPPPSRAQGPAGLGQPGGPSGRVCGVSQRVATGTSPLTSLPAGHSPAGPRAALRRF